MARSPTEWSAILKANPFPKKAKDDPAHLVCLVCKAEPDARQSPPGSRPSADKVRQGRKTRNRRPRNLHRLWRLDRRIETDPAQEDVRRCGTARNWNTMLKLDAMLND